ncbi:CHAP domain-containing protein [Plantactinospora soyae]|uniref:Surface antigen n=1 Tax=Plantactinospora soyae TaxID=1544732 RepID=A0A927M783_9ACTN|nr:CHAP domain-containing protein [Plantactinospora soyae]MBE1488307.1 surface antigen [Plantactinospora soyae]
MSKHIAARVVAAVGLLVVTALGQAATAAPAQAAVTVRVESTITAHDLPYLNSPYIEGSALSAGQYVSVECYIRGREYVGDNFFWYRINTRYYPAYAIATATGIPQCGGPSTVPSAANGYSSPSFDAPFATGWFDSNETVQVLCVAAGQTYNGSNAWYFVKGYFLHASRLATRPALYTCRGFSTPGSVTNDYPYRGQTSGVDRWNFYKGQCTSFVAWRLNDRNNIAFHNYYRSVHWGNAYNWENAARSAGITVNSTPRVGSVAQTDSGSGHVAWVAAVHSDGTVTVEEYNYATPSAYGTRRVSSSRFVYLHFPQA